MTTQRRIDEKPAEVGSAVRAIKAAQRALAEDPSLATQASQGHFGDDEAGLIAELISRDAPFYDPTISERSVAALNRFAGDLGLLTTDDVPYERVVATRYQPEGA